ncbi:MAG: hypothetical protein RKE49_01560 [Oceanicaulis sp.]
MKPRIIIHPGLPKCATSAIQRAFVIHDHALARALGLDFISADFRINAGYPDVIKVMDDPDGYREALAAAEFPDGRYFLSSEALLGIDPSIFCDRFEVERWAVTVRAPFLQSLSNYRFSGWVSGGFKTWSAKRANHFDAAAGRQVDKVSRLKPLPGRLMLVALESAQAGVVSHFCTEVFERRPAVLDEIDSGAQAQVNASISFALADALGRRLEQSGTGAVSVALRRRLVKAAQAFETPEDLRSLAPAAFAEEWSHYTGDALQRYRELLALGQDNAGREAALDAAESKIMAALAAPVADAHQLARLDDHAEQIIDTCLAASTD